MAFDEAGVGDSMWGALAIAKALTQFSTYPLILLTNATHFPDGTRVKESFAELNTQIAPVHKVEVKGHQGWTLKRWTYAFWKLQVWRLTGFDQLVWLDADSLVFRNLDWIFDRPGMWAQRDAWFCDAGATGVCSGIISLYPSVQDYEGMLRYAEQVGDDLRTGDQLLIEWYFARVKKQPVNLLTSLEASFGQCAGSSSTPYGVDGKPVPGAWNVPAFVHKSGGWDNTVSNAYNNVCFLHDLARQRYYVGDRVINVCHFNPLAATWRKHFCSAAAWTALRVPSVTEFCDDHCYFLGELPGDSLRCPALGDIVSGPVEGSVGRGAELGADALGRWLPAPEQLRAQAVYQFKWGQSWGVPERSIEYHGAALPRPPYSVRFGVLAAKPRDCQAVIAWHAAHAGVEIRLNGGNVVYGELHGKRWHTVRTENLAIADGSFHQVAVSRTETGAVEIYHGGLMVENGTVQAEPPLGLPDSAFSRREGSCSLSGEVKGLALFAFALEEKQAQELLL